MVAGDVVNGAAAAGFDFRPAAGVECAITSFGNFNAWAAFASTTAAVNIIQGTSNSAGSGNGNTKIMINNTIWLRLNTSTDGSSFSGIQIK